MAGALGDPDGGTLVGPGAVAGLAADLRAGTRLGPFLLDEVVGRGSAGVVYRAIDLVRGGELAVKVMLPDAGDLDDSGARFAREARVAGTLDHPAILPVLATGEDDGLRWLATPFVDGPDLERLLRDEGPLEPLRAATLLGQVARGLDHAHVHGLVHRDVKPGNILVEGDVALLADFGLTKGGTESVALTSPGQFVGTVAYIAPEQTQGDPLDGRADQYSLACVLHHALTGGPPFEGTVLEVVFGHVNEPPPSLRARRPELPPALDAVVARALAKDPADRFPTCTDFLDAVRTVVA